MNTCGDGTRINRRTKKTEEANGGICEGEATIEDVCNTEVCPRKYLGPKKEYLYQMIYIEKLIMDLIKFHLVHVYFHNYIDFSSL